MRKITIALLLIVLCFCTFAETKENLPQKMRHSLGSSLFMLVNAVPDQDNPPGYFMLRYGYKFLLCCYSAKINKFWKLLVNSCFYFFC